MQKYTKNYLASMGFDVCDFVPCEICTAEAIDIHHVTPKSVGGSDDPENLIALCRLGMACHDRAAAGKLGREELNAVVRERMGDNYREGFDLKKNVREAA